MCSALSFYLWQLILQKRQPALISPTQYIYGKNFEPIHMYFLSAVVCASGGWLSQSFRHEFCQQSKPRYWVPTNLTVLIYSSTPPQTQINNVHVLAEPAKRWLSLHFTNVAIDAFWSQIAKIITSSWLEASRRVCPLCLAVSRTQSSFALGTINKWIPLPVVWAFKAAVCGYAHVCGYVGVEDHSFDYMLFIVWLLEGIRGTVVAAHCGGSTLWW